MFQKVKAILNETVHDKLKTADLGTEDPVIAQIREYIDQHYDQKITLETLAKLAYMNPSYFSTFFKQKFGCNFKDYLIRVRMNRASQLLRSTKLKTDHIASLVGYDDYRYFSKIFKQVTGKSTTQMRKDE